MRLWLPPTPETGHARDLMRESVLPSSEGFKQSGLQDTAKYITKAVGETDFGGSCLSYGKWCLHNLGVYYVFAVYQRCGNPPPGYSTEQGEMVFVQTIGKWNRSRE